jgi:hypothetical protein
MNEAEKRAWDVRLGIATPIVAVLGLLAGVWQFNVGEDHRRESETAASLTQARLQIEKAQIDYRQLLRQERLAAYTNIATLAGQIAVAPPGRARKKAMQAFEAAYWGAMVVAEDKPVADAMRDFHDELHDEVTGWSKDPARLEIRANLLAAACQRSLAADNGAVLASKS